MWREEGRSLSGGGAYRGEARKRKTNTKGKRARRRQLLLRWATVVERERAAEEVVGADR